MSSNNIIKYETQSTLPGAFPYGGNRNFKCVWNREGGVAGVAGGSKCKMCVYVCVCVTGMMK